MNDSAILLCTLFFLAGFLVCLLIFHTESHPSFARRKKKMDQMREEIDVLLSTFPRAKDVLSLARAVWENPTIHTPLESCDCPACSEWKLRRWRRQLKDAIQEEHFEEAIILNNKINSIEKSITSKL